MLHNPESLTVFPRSENLEPGHDPANDEQRYQRARKDGGGVFEVRISRTSRTQAGSSVAEKIDKWFRCNPEPKAGTSVRIPDYHFDPRYF